jgi:hypothetical protein
VDRPYRRHAVTSSVARGQEGAGMAVAAQGIRYILWMPTGYERRDHPRCAGDARSERLDLVAPNAALNVTVRKNERCDCRKNSAPDSPGLVLLLHPPGVRRTEAGRWRAHGRCDRRRRSGAEPAERKMANESRYLAENACAWSRQPMAWDMGATVPRRTLSGHDRDRGALALRGNSSWVSAAPWDGH